MGEARKTSGGRRSAGAWLRNELREMIPVALFFLGAFELLALTEALLMRGHGGGPAAYIGAAVGALLVAKVVVIVDHFRFMRRFEGRPLIYAIVWSAVVYFVVATLVRGAEQAVHEWRGAAEAGGHVTGAQGWTRAALVHLWLMVLLGVFCTFREIVRAMGSRDALELLLTRRAARREAERKGE